MKNLLVILMLCSFSISAQTTKPFTRWWWMGNSLTKNGIKEQLLSFQKAGLGGVEITPIYGVKGQEEHEIDHLSPEWFELLDYTVHVADSLGLKVDMILGSGWPYGGQHVTSEFAATKLRLDSLDLPTGSSIDKLPIVNDRLLYTLAYGKNGDYQEVTVGFKAMDQPYKILFVYADKTAQMVKRAGPGGAGFTLDHFSTEALNHYLIPYNKTLKAPLRAIFNDSFELYGANFSSNFFEEFTKRRNYDLKPHLRIINHDTEKSNRLRYDYRLTLSEILKESFTQSWSAWANQKGYKTKLQAHGSPGNLLDLYGAADIPECETFGSMPFDIKGFRREKTDIREGDADEMMLKFSSSAANVLGKPLVSSETFTWLRDHFKTALSQCKPEVEDLFLSGVNHVFLHGNTYSPSQATWPGWNFYAATNFSPQLPIWEHAPSLFSYIENCQKILQSSKPDNEIALYWPVHDLWSLYSNGSLNMNLNIHSLNDWLKPHSFYQLGGSLIKKGYSLDFVSDDFLMKATVQNGNIVFPGGQYKSIIVPRCTNMPLATLEKLLILKKEGAKVIFEAVPLQVPGFEKYESRNVQFQENAKNLMAENVVFSLQSIGIEPESIARLGLKFLRKTIAGKKVYFIANHSKDDFEQYISLQSNLKIAVLYDPNTNIKGNVKMDSKSRIRVQLKSGESIFIFCDQKVDYPFPYYKVITSVELKEPMRLNFINGGPTLPKKVENVTPGSWTKINQETQSFSGTAVYEMKFDAPVGKFDCWAMELKDVRESARIFLNGKMMGTVWANPFQIILPKIKKTGNHLKIEVVNLGANRIRSMEMEGKEWKIFKEINMVDKDYKPFDATKWEPMPSGILNYPILKGLKED